MSAGDEIEGLVASAGADLVDVETQQAADQLHYWWHIYDPLSNQQAHEVLLGGYLDAAGELAEARRAHDSERAERLWVELRNLTVLLAASSTGRDCARLRWILTLNRPWPLSGMR